MERSKQQLKEKEDLAAKIQQQNNPVIKKELEKKLLDLDKIIKK